MKPTALDVLVCPACKADLDLQAAAVQGQEILDGTLTCSACHRCYPIRGGVPRFVPDGLYANSFGRQWNWFRTVQLDSETGTSRSEEALRGATGWRDDEYRGRRLLDAGVGAGRFAERAASKGAEVFGIDLTTAVDAAYRNIGQREGVHLIQADIFALPFRSETFDLAYSIGVLHHTPDPAAAFRHVADVVKPEGRFAVYLYSRYGISHRMSDVIRRVTTRLPLGVMWALSAGSRAALLPVSPPGGRHDREPRGADFHGTPLAMAVAGHVRLVHTEVSVQVSLPGNFPLVSGRRLSRDRDLRGAGSDVRTKATHQGDERWPTAALARSGGVLKSRRRQPFPGVGGRSLAFGGLVFFTVVLLLSPQTFFPVLKTVRIALLAAGVAIAAHAMDATVRREPITPSGSETSITFALLGWTVSDHSVFDLAGRDRGGADRPIHQGVGLLLDDCRDGHQSRTSHDLGVVADGVLDSARRDGAAAFREGRLSLDRNVHQTHRGLCGPVGKPERSRAHAEPVDPVYGRAAVHDALVDGPGRGGVRASAQRPSRHRHVFSRRVSDTRGDRLMGAFCFMRRRAVLPAVGVIVLALGIMPILPNGYVERLSTIVDIDADPTGSAQGRWTDYQVATDVVIANPILGVGLGQDILALNAARGRPTWRSVHNAFLEYAVDLGIPGILLFLSLLFVSFGTARRVERLRLARPIPVGRQRVRGGGADRARGVLGRGVFSSDCLSVLLLLRRRARRRRQKREPHRSAEAEHPGE